MISKLFILALLLTTVSAAVTQTVQVLEYVKPVPIPTLTRTKVVTSTKAESLETAKSSNRINDYHGKYHLNVSFAQLILDRHNEKRALHGSQSLVWSSGAYEFAYEYAQDYDCTGILKHSGGITFGENLAIGYTPTGAVDAWYNEGEDYQYGSDEKTYNHFTALIWNSTSSIGCAYKFCNNVWGTYIVCSYYPPGNIIGQSSKNVLPLVN